jgi:hypothetical protein
VIGRVDKVSRGHTLRKLDAGLRVNSDSMYKGQALVGVEDFEEVCRGADDAEIVHDSACGDIEGNDPPQRLDDTKVCRGFSLYLRVLMVKNSLTSLP